MRWRSGANQPQNEVINDAVPVSPIVDEEDEQSDEQDSSSPSHIDNPSDDPTHGRLGGAATTSSLPPPTDAQDNKEEEIEEKPPKMASTTSSTPSTPSTKGKSAPVTEEDDDDGEEEDDDDDDDPGSDHADDGQSSSSWKPQNQQSTCEFMHTIADYSQKRESGCKKAEYSATTVDDFGNKWRLIVYVNGNGRASNHHLSLFLQVADADELPFGWKKAVSYVLTLEHPSGGNLGYAKRNPDKTFKLCPKAIDWGWSQFITSDRIQQEGFVSDDSLTVRASVTVKSSSVSIDPEDAELYLKCAVEEGNADAVKVCLSQGAGVNCQFKDDLYTPLHTACSSSASSGSLEVLNLLLEKGADGNACNKWRETPLLIAANNGHKAAVEALLEHGADPSLCSEAGWSALTFAAHKGYDDIVALLLKAGAPVNCRVTEDLSTPLHKACAGGKPGHFSAVKQLLEFNADVHALNKWRETPLLTAANHGQAASVEALLASGADPCKCTDTGWSPLSIAAYKGHDDVVRLLLEEGAPTEEADPTLSALLQAATKGLPDTVELLLRHGADHTVTTKKGDTALSILVEQNLIDAAVEMVTEYKASVPRCSRDRKKVQRARLLINLRVKQQQREGLLNLSTDEDETDDESEESKSALHDAAPEAAGPPGGKKKKKKRDNASRESAEAQARAAEEALLLELELEESKAQKDEAAANSKRAKKKKRKERERQQRLKEEQEQKEREEREAQKRERERKIKEDNERKEREQRLQEQRAREMQAAAKRKEREDKERKQRDLERKERERLDKKPADTNPISPRGKATTTKGKMKVKAHEIRHWNGQQTAHYAPQKTAASQPIIAKSPNHTPNKRGWEVQPSSPPPLTAAKSQPIMRDRSPSGAANQARGGTQPTQLPKRKSESEIQIQNGLLALESNSESTLSDTKDPGPQNPSHVSAQKISSEAIPTSRILRSRTQNDVSSLTTQPTVPMNGISQQLTEVEYEIPEVSLLRQEKLLQLFQRCAVARSQPQQDPLGSVSEAVVKTVTYRWIVRAAHDTAPYLDPIIPSWTDFDLLTTFFQRQFISESRKGVSSARAGGLVSMEALREAGASFSRICHALAKELVSFWQRREHQLPSNWSDSTLGLTGSEVLRNGMGSVVCINWANRAQVYLPTLLFAKVSERHSGSSTRLLTALFAAKKRYETKGMLVDGTAMDYRLSLMTKEFLSRDAMVSVELWVDPFSVYASNSFFGQFADVDTSFGGYAAFGKEGVSTELALLKRGASVVVLPPLDNMIASLYIRRVVDLLVAGDIDSIPLSFVIVLRSECFRGMNRSPTLEDVTVMDPRLGEKQNSFVRCAEVLPPGQHTFSCGESEGSYVVSHTGSLFLLLQNDAGKTRYLINEASLLKIVRSMSVNVTRDAHFGAPIGYPNEQVAEVAPVAAAPFPIGTDSPLRHDQQRHQHELNTISIQSANGNFAGNGPSRPHRRGRFFDLIDDGEDDNAADVDVVSGMLTNLDANIFGTNMSHDVDIEAISLMGIGGAPLGDPALGATNTNGRTHGRFG